MTDVFFNYFGPDNINLFVEIFLYIIPAIILGYYAEKLSRFILRITYQNSKVRKAAYSLKRIKNSENIANCLLRFLFCMLFLFVTLAIIQLVFDAHLAKPEPIFNYLFGYILGCLGNMERFNKLLREYFVFLLEEIKKPMIFSKIMLAIISIFFAIYTAVWARYELRSQNAIDQFGHFINLYQNTKTRRLALELIPYNQKVKYYHDPVWYKLATWWGYTDNRYTHLLIRFVEQEAKNGDLTNINFNNANLSGAMLEGANMSHTSLINTRLDKADLSGGNVSYAVIENTTFRKAILKSVNFYKSKLKAANFEHADMTGAKLVESKVGRERIDTLREKLDDPSVYSIFKTGVRRGTKFFCTNLANVDFTGVDLSGITLENSNLYNAKMKGAINIEKAFFINTNWWMADISYDQKNKLKDALDCKVWVKNFLSCEFGDDKTWTHLSPKINCP